MPTVTKTLGDGTQSVLLTVAILECLASQKRPISVSELAKSIGTSKSRIFRHLRTLLACNYVTQREAGGDYGIGPRLLALCRSTADRHDLTTIAAAAMDGLCARFRHSVIVSRVERDGVHVLKSISGHASIMLGVREGTVLPFDRSAQGKIALAFGDEMFAEARARFAGSMARELGAIRRDEIAVAQMRAGLMGVAAPIFDANGRLVGTLALLNTVAEMKSDEAAAFPALREAAQAVSRLLGHQGEPFLAPIASAG
jgi:IclR family transcriptional regulator, KDG regulon repressor